MNFAPANVTLIRSFDTGVDEDASYLGRDAVSTGNYKYSRVDRE